MSQSADFTDSELWIIKTTLEERYGEQVEPALADTELRLDPGLTELTVCPAAYWERDDCHFVVAKTGDIMTMPGLPRVPAAAKIRWQASGSS